MEKQLVSIASAVFVGVLIANQVGQFLNLAEQYSFMILFALGATILTLSQRKMIERIVGK